MNHFYASASLQLELIHSALDTIHFLLSTFYFLLFTFYFPHSTQIKSILTFVFASVWMNHFYASASLQLELIHFLLFPFYSISIYPEVPAIKASTLDESFLRIRFVSG
ncbi:MAG: hypothetical protein R2850_12605 [Bacteroidia bacterium]